MRAAKQCLNGIDPVDPKRSYRFEQGFTFELNLAGVGDEARAAFVEKRDAEAVAVKGSPWPTSAPPPTTPSPSSPTG